jgi:hypothetical protein
MAHGLDALCCCESKDIGWQKVINHNNDRDLPSIQGHSHDEQLMLVFGL